MEGPNIGISERWASAIGGGMLVLAGLGRRSIGGLAVAAVGAVLIARGVTGESDLYRELGFYAAEPDGAVPPEDTVAEASDESFPASDAPSWTPTTSMGGPEHQAH